MRISMRGGVYRRRGAPLRARQKQEREFGRGGLLCGRLPLWLSRVHPPSRSWRRNFVDRPTLIANNYLAIAAGFLRILHSVFHDLKNTKRPLITVSDGNK